MRVNINIRPSTKEVLKTWAEKYTNGHLSPIIDTLLEYANANYGFVVPGRVSSRSEVGQHTVHMRVEVFNEDYIQILEQLGRHSMRISLSRILEYIVNEEGVTPDMFDFQSYEGTPIGVDKAIDIKKAIEQEQTKLMMLPGHRYHLVNSLWNELFEELWPILNYLCIKTNTNSEAVDKLRKAIDIAKNLNFKA